MALIITPAQFARRAEFYHQLAQLTAAGLGLVAALEQLQRSPPDRSFREPIRRLLANLSEGSTLTEGIQQAGQWLPQFDIALLNAGEQSGRLDSCFRLLGEYYADRARVARQMLADLAYPAFLLHFAVFILPFADLFKTGNWVAYLLKTFGLLIPLYAVIALGIYAAQSKHGERWRSIVEKLLHPIPMLGTGRRYLALARLATALEALLSAGVTIIEAWELAAAASGSPAVRRVVVGWRRQVDGGVTPAEALRASGFFPDLFVTQYATGEVSGQLDDTLRRLHRYFYEEGSRKLHAVAQWTPRGVYLLIALGIAYKVVSWWADYFDQVRKAGGF
jgi:type II secretory pathway component PulF